MSDYTIIQAEGKSKGGIVVASKKIRQIAYSAIMAAMVCAATMVIRIPSPTGGYINPGDGLVLLCGWLLGPWYGGAAAGIGSMLADLMMGYAAYAPGSLLIKGVEALAAGLLFRAMNRSFQAQLFSGLMGGAIMTAGYFGYTALLLGRGLGAAVSVPGNLVQAAMGIVLSILIYHALRHTLKDSRMMNERGV